MWPRAASQELLSPEKPNSFGVHRMWGPQRPSALGLLFNPGRGCGEAEAGCLGRCLQFALLLLLVLPGKSSMVAGFKKPAQRSSIVSSA